MFLKKGNLEWQQISEPVISEPSEALVRPFIAARCDLDAGFLKYNIHGRYKLGKHLGLTDPTIPYFTRPDILKGPFPMGHECIAEVVETGKEVNGFQKGQKVIIPFQVSCGTCPICSTGLTSQCEEYGAFDMFSGIGKHLIRGGMIADLFLVPNASKMMIPVPEDIDLVSIGSASDNLADAWSRVKHLVNTAGKRVLVIGGSTKSISLYAVAFALKMDTEQVDYVDTSKERLAIAQTLGANTHTPDQFNTENYYDLVVNGTNNPKMVARSIKWLRSGGTYECPNIYFNKNVSVPLFQMYAKNLTLKTGLANPMADIIPMLQFIRKKEVDLTKVNTHIGQWDDAPIDLLKNTTKVILQRSPIY